MTPNELTEEERDALEASKRPPKTQDELDYLNYQRIEHEAAARENFIQEQHNKQNIEHQKAYDEMQDQERKEALEEYKAFMSSLVQDPDITIEEISSPFKEDITIIHRKKVETAPELLQRATTILDEDPLKFLLDDLHKRVPGNQQISKMLILGFMSMHSKIDILLHQFITGSSGRGKSYEIHQCAKLLDRVYRVPFEHITPKALNYYCENDGTADPEEEPIRGTIKNKFLYLDDITESDTIILKMLGNNDGEIPNGGNVINQQYVSWQWDGYPLTVVSKVALIEDDEDGQLRSRYLVYGVEESDEHLKEITDNMMEKECNITTAASMDPVCPYITNECLSLPISGIEITTSPSSYPPRIEPRNLNFFISLIKCNALLNHKNRTIKDNILYTSTIDLETAFSIWEEISVHNDSNLTTIQLRILANLNRVNHPRTRDQTIPGMVDLGFGSDPTLKKELDKLEFIGKISHLGKRPKSYFLL